MPTKIVKLGLIPAVLLVWLTSAYAWDGERQGLVLGFGLGAGLTTFKESVESHEVWTGAYLPVATNFSVGFATSNTVHLCWVSNVSWLKVQDGDIVSSGVGGLGVRVYEEYEAPSVYLTGAAGVAWWTKPFAERTDDLYGFGIIAGAGYEFSPHRSIEGSIQWGRPGRSERGYRTEINVLTIQIALNILGY